MHWAVRLERFVRRRFPHRVRVIPDRNDRAVPYLTRIYLLGSDETGKHSKSGRPWPRWAPVIAIHIFHQSDSDPYLHTHPWWWFWTRRLIGGYFERTPDGTFFRRPGSSAVMRNDSPHHVTLTQDWCPCYTLVVMGPRAKGWGFLIGDKLVDHDTHLGTNQ